MKDGRLLSSERRRQLVQEKERRGNRLRDGKTV
jgi:hypothetical protein